MKLMIIRHGDPDYVNDALTEKGVVEADLLAKWFKRLKPAAVYSSPLGRAHQTCLACKKECGFDYEILPWLREFNAYVYNPNAKKRTYVWDLMPSFFTKRPLLYDSNRWKEDVLFANSDLNEKYDGVKEGFLALLKKHGYEKDGKMFRAVCSNEDTVVLFCHFGVLCVMMAELTGFSPYVFWQHFCALPTSVTTFATEEREEGKAVFRCIGFGDLSHLALGGEEASFAARYCETFDSPERH